MIAIPAYCLYLPEKPERQKKCAAYFNSINLPVRWIAGVNGEKFGLKTVYPYEVDHPGSGWNIGWLTGCWLSHWLIWNLIAHQWDPHVLVLEDDARFPADWHTQLTQALNDVPGDFDCLYIGSCCTEGRPKTQIKGSIYEVKYPVCTHAIIWAKKAMPKVLETQRKVYAPIDISLAFHTLPYLKCYTVLPRIVDQFDTMIQP